MQIYIHQVVNIAKKWKVELCLFLFSIALLYGKFHSLIGSEELAGWDTSGHYYALTRMAYDFLPSFKISGYDLNNFGGYPMFTLYPPFWYISISLIWYFFLETIPLLLIYRTVIFSLIIAFVFIFWYFIKVFFGRDAARVGIPISLCYLLYPLAPGLSNIGISAFIWGGLQTNFLGIELTLLWIIFIKKLTKKHSAPIFLLFIITTFAVTITHILWFIFIAGFMIFTFLFYKRIKLAVMLIMGFAAGLLLASFWFVPFLLNHNYWGGSRLDSDSNFFSILSDLYPFDPRRLLDLQSYFYLNWWVVFIFIFSIYGYFVLFKKKKFYLPAAIILITGCLSFNIGSVIFPDLQVHYYRYIPIIMIVTYMIAAYGLSEVVVKLKKKSFVFHFLLYILLFGFLLHESYIFEYGINPFWQQNRHIYSTNLGAHYNLSDYPLHQEASIVLANLKSFPTQRIYAQISQIDGLISIGSTHYFATELPLHNNQSEITGLFAESTQLSSFIIPLSGILSRNTVNEWGDISLNKLQYMSHESLSVLINKLKLFGVDTVITYKTGLSDSVFRFNAFDAELASGRYSLLFHTPHFFVYHLPDAKKLVYVSPVKPGIFYSNSKNIVFDDIAKESFASENIFQFPIINATNNDLEKIATIQRNFSYLLVNATNSNASTIATINSFKIPIIILNPTTETLSQLHGKDLYSVYQYTAFHSLSTVKTKPSSWVKMENLINSLSKKNTAGKISNVSISSSQIAFSGTGPVVLNAGFFPNWINKSCVRCSVFQTTPGSEMLIFANGKTVLQYELLSYEKIAQLISVSVIIAMLTYCLIIKKKKNKLN